MTDLSTLGRRVRHFRAAAGLTLEQLGADVGVAASQLSLIENGRREPRLSLLSAIADRLGVPLQEVLDASPPTSAPRSRSPSSARSQAPRTASLACPN